MKLDNSKIFGILILIIFILIVVSFFTSGKKSEEPENVVIGLPDRIDGEEFDPETLLSRGATLNVNPEDRLSPRVMAQEERPEPQEAPRRLANLHKDAVAKRREKALAIRNAGEENLDSASKALLDSLRKVRAIQEAEGTR